MPYKRVYRKKRNYRRKRIIRRPKLRLGKPLRPAVYYFKRSYVQTFNLTDPPADWDHPTPESLTTTQVFQLNDLHNASDFTNLFHMYKIVAVGMKMYFSSTNVDQVVSSGDQIIVYIAPNQTGSTHHTLDENYFLTNSSTKTRIGINGQGKPIKTYNKVRQLADRYSSAVNTDYATVRPAFVSTSETTTSHMGNDMRIQLVNNLAITRTAVKIIYTYYIMCKQVQ